MDIDLMNKILVISGVVYSSSSLYGLDAEVMCGNGFVKYQIDSKRCSFSLIKNFHDIIDESDEDLISMTEEEIKDYLN